jgi:4-hydroxy-tetrahydrodipicolinate synthase
MMKKKGERVCPEAVVAKFGRILLPLITVFKNDLSVDYALTKKVARFVVENKFCDSIIVSGTTGEFYALSLDERVKLFQAIKEEFGDTIPLIAGTGSASTREVIELTKVAEKLGYDAVMVVAPYYSHPEQEGIYQHFKAVAQSTSLPLMIYNIPLFSGVNIAPETVARLAEIENIIAIKDEAGLNPLQATAYIQKTEGRLAVYSGDDPMVLQVLIQGGVGVVSGGSHVIGDMMRHMINDFLAGRNDQARETYHRLMKLFTAFQGKDGRRTNPTPLVKAAFELFSGLPTSLPRPPLTPATEEEKDLLQSALKAIGKL